MAVVVSFFSPSSMGSVHAPALGGARVTEIVTIPDSTTATAEPGEAALVVNNETDPVMVAIGATPDASALAQTAATSAAVCVPAGGSLVLRVPAGARVDVRAVPA